MPKTRAVKHAEAVERAEARATRTWQEQLLLIAARPGHSKKEIARMGANLDGKYIEQNDSAGTITVRDTPPGAGYGKAQTIQRAKNVNQ